MSEAIITVEDVYKSYLMGKEAVPALRGVSLEIQPTEFVCLMGPSGSGKTTLLNIIGGPDEASRGHVTVEGQNLVALSENELARLRLTKMGFIFQNYNLLANFTAHENVEAPMVLAKVGRKERKERAHKLLERVGLADRAHHYPTELSGGQQQRVAIARALGKAAALDGAAQAFLAIQALINIYGLVALGVVGLLIYTLVMTNVQEQRRDMAVLRILGGQRGFLFTLVIAEVLVIGAIGVGLGLVLGQLITGFIAVRLIQQQMMQEGINSSLTPQVTLSTLLPIIVIAFIVLIVASIRPAQIASQTKVVHAINPGMADNIQIEDLATLRERNPNKRLFLAGLGLI